MTDIAPNEDLVIDGSLLGEIARRQLRWWILVAPLIMAALIYFALSFLPQTYTATVSIAVQQSSPVQSPLAALAGVSSSKRYLGILKSRTLAADVETHAHLQEMYRLPTAEKAWEMLMLDALKVRDNPNDGLLYLDVSLPGPPRLSHGQEARRDEVQKTTALIANDYAKALQKYYAEYDNDRDTVLLRGAQEKLATARQIVEEKQRNYLAFLRGLKNVDARALPNESGSGGTPSASPSELQGLYERLTSAEIDIATNEASRQKQRTILNKQLENLPSLPSEDQLLALQRGRVDDAREEYNRLRVQLADDNPRVVAAKKRLDLELKELEKQTGGLRNDLTTDQAKISLQLEAAYAKKRDVLAKIASATKRLGVRREVSAEMERLRGEMNFSMETLKTVALEAAKLDVSSVSAQSRITVVDDAIVPTIGSPGIVKVTLFVTLLAFALFGISVLVEYNLRSRRRAPVRETPRPAMGNRT